MNKTRLYLLSTLLLPCSLLAQPPQADMDTSMSFFLTSVNMGDGANLGGLEGADAHCAALAEEAGVTDKTWHAYLSTDSVDARDRIGNGPWFNAEGEMVAASVDELHYSNVNLNKATVLTEAGSTVNGRSDDPNEHDILTGSNPDGTFSGANCSNWSSNAGDGSASVGHFDRTGGGALATSWNSAHTSRGCGADDLRGTGGNGYFYCFAE